jgi:phosphoribosylformylglycinamidine (FGAM) synthase-like enzyme
MQKEVKKRTSKTNQEFQIKKALIVKEKLENPDIKVRELQEKYNIDHSIISRTLKKELSTIDTEKNKIVELATNNVAKGNEIIRQYIEQMKVSDLRTQSDLNLFTSSIKNQQSLVSMIE